MNRNLKHSTRLELKTFLSRTTNQTLESKTGSELSNTTGVHLEENPKNDEYEFYSEEVVLGGYDEKIAYRILGIDKNYIILDDGIYFLVTDDLASENKILGTSEQEEFEDDPVPPKYVIFPLLEEERTIKFFYDEESLYFTDDERNTRKAFLKGAYRIT